MPVIQPGPISYTLTVFSVDMLNLTASATFRATVGGVAVGEVSIGVGPDALVPLLQKLPDAGKSRADDITDAIYQHAISVGALPSGEIA